MRRTTDRCRTVLLDSLRDRGLTIAIAESGAGGRFGSLLLSEPSSSGRRAWRDDLSEQRPHSLSAASLADIRAGAVWQ